MLDIAVVVLIFVFVATVSFGTGFCLMWLACGGKDSAVSRRRRQRKERKDA